MKIADITDISVYPMHTNSVRIGWMALGTRYHVNVLRDTGAVQTPQFGSQKNMKALYKNPPLDIKYGQPGYYRTVTVNAEAASNAKFVQHVLKHVADNDMIEEAYRDQFDAETAKRNARNADILHKMRIILCDNGMPGQDLDLEQALDIITKAREV